MPELPEVETIKNEIAEAVTNAKVLKVKIYNRCLREKIPDGTESKIEGNDFLRCKRIGKYIIIEMSNDYAIVWHLGMSGRIRLSNNFSELEKHDHIVIETTKGIMVYNDPRRFGLFVCLPIDDLEKSKYFRKMGIDPFDVNFDEKYLFAQLKGKNIPIKTALLNQEIVNGIGNIYASEILYDCKISPLRKSCDIKLQECKKIVLSVRKILLKAIENGGSTLKDYHKIDGSVGNFQNLHCVYNKSGQKCPECKCNILRTGGIKKIVQAGRSTFYCATLQK